MYVQNDASKSKCFTFRRTTNHLDLESITLNNSFLISKETFLFFSTTKCFKTVCNRIIELTPKGVIDRDMTYDEYLEDKKIKELQTTNVFFLKVTVKNKGSKNFKVFIL